MTADDRVERFRLLYERRVRWRVGAAAEADRVLDAVEADLALARGRILHARFLAERADDPAGLEPFERAAQLCEALGEPADS